MHLQQLKGIQSSNEVCESGTFFVKKVYKRVKGYKRAPPPGPAAPGVRTNEAVDYSSFCSHMST